VFLVRPIHPYVGGYPCGWRRTQKLPTPTPLELDVQVRVPQAAHTLEQLAAADPFISAFCPSTMKAYFKKQQHTGKGSEPGSFKHIRQFV
jgi:hypothetical protein